MIFYRKTCVSFKIHTKFINYIRIGQVVLNITYIKNDSQMFGNVIFHDFENRKYINKAYILKFPSKIFLSNEYFILKCFNKLFRFFPSHLTVSSNDAHTLLVRPKGIAVNC